MLPCTPPPHSAPHPLTPGPTTWLHICPRYIGLLKRELDAKSGKMPPGFTAFTSAAFDRKMFKCFGRSETAKLIAEVYDAVTERCGFTGAFRCVCVRMAVPAAQMPRRRHVDPMARRLFASLSDAVC